MGLDPDDVFWDIRQGGSGPETGLHWFLVEIHGIERSKHGVFNQLSLDPVETGSRAPTEEPEFLYVELDAQLGKTRARLQTIAHPGRRSLKTATLFFYEATTDVKNAERSKEAVGITVMAVLDKWIKTPLFSGDKRLIPYETRRRATPEYADEIFQLPTGFYGLPNEN
jgi:hypothetical protein